MLLRESNQLGEYTGEEANRRLSQGDTGDEERIGVWVESLVPQHWLFQMLQLQGLWWLISPLTSHHSLSLCDRPPLLRLSLIHSLAFTSLLQMFSHSWSFLLAAFLFYPSSSFISDFLSSSSVLRLFFFVLRCLHCSHFSLHPSKLHPPITLSSFWTLFHYASITSSSSMPIQSFPSSSYMSSYRSWPGSAPGRQGLPPTSYLIITVIYINKDGSWDTENLCISDLSLLSIAAYFLFCSVLQQSVQIKQNFKINL